ncbi:MAG: D-alanyl-D-alanine carboxypeptidase [Clostridiales bacterium]|nr:D-alanyl-D-alanine carboxypeptidase [Clostridiales bacterium]
MKNLKKFIAVVLTAFMLLPSAHIEAAQHDNLTDLGLTAQSAILMEASTGDILYEQNSDEMLPPASVTKVMTLLLIYEAVEDGKIKWDDKVTVSAHAASMGGSQVYLEEGETQTVADMTKCIAIASANDAAVAMAEYIGGSEEGFVELMNSRAKELGMENTTFVNACGLDTDGHLTTARDIAIMSRELIYNFPEITEYTTTWQDTITHTIRKGESEFGLTNTNKLIRWYDGATGLKTGSTGNAKYCLSATADKNGMQLIAVIMAAPDPKTRFSEAIKLLDYGYANYTVVSGAKAGGSAGEIPVSRGEQETVQLEVASDVNALIQKGGEEPTLTIDITNVLCAPIEKGVKAGEAVYTLNGEVLARADVVTAEAVERAGLSTVVERLLKGWCR